MRIPAGILFILILVSCVTRVPQYADPEFDSGAIVEDHGEQLYSIYFVGDAGNAPENESLNVLSYLRSELSGKNGQSAIVWLGDNIYPVGLAPENHPDYKLGRHRIEKQLEVHDQYSGRIFFIPGNHDWYRYGREGIRRQERIIESYLANRIQHNDSIQNNYFIPDDGCGAIHTIKIAEDISMLLMDSAWFLAQLNKNTEVADCAVKTIPAFLQQLRDSISLLKGQSVIVALHHPPHTFGSHGGKYKMKDYLFPLSQLKSKLLIPLPVTGLIVNKMRNYISEQDNKSLRYRLLREELEMALEEMGASLVVGGHEHNMQYIELNGNYYVVSGAGSKNNPVGLGKGSKFSVGEKGYVKLEFRQSDVGILKYFLVNEEGDKAKLVYQKKIIFRI